nr:ATP-binding protein [Clostridium beijerinckii]
MLNLLSNAIKFTSSGGSIFVNILDKDSSIIVSVRDTGVGIPKDKQLSIFKRFVQVDKSLSRKREGSGIGLSLVKSLVELHNGTIKINSEYGKGSEFIIELPVKVLPESENVTSDEDLAKESNIQRIKIEFSDIYD